MTRWFTYHSSLVAFSVFLVGCGAQTPASPSLATPLNVVGADATRAARPASRCVNVSLEGVADLNIINGSLGALPFNVTIGDVRGEMHSVITGANPSGQGSTHYTLQHRFDSTDSSRPGWFETEDRAVCALAGSDPNVCRVNDVLQVVRGAGVFANAGGFLTNHGTIDLTNFVPFVTNGALTVDLGGRVCGDGL
jgi:hypothetical protein